MVTEISKQQPYIIPGSLFYCSGCIFNSGYCSWYPTYPVPTHGTFSSISLTLSLKITVCISPLRCNLHTPAIYYSNNCVDTNSAVLLPSIYLHTYIYIFNCIHSNELVRPLLQHNFTNHSNTQKTLISQKYNQLC